MEDSANSGIRKPEADDLILHKKRKRKLPRRLYYSSDSSDSELEEKSRHERPPKVRGAQAGPSRTSTPSRTFLDSELSYIKTSHSSKDLFANDTGNNVFIKKILSILLTIKEQNNQIIQLFKKEGPSWQISGGCPELPVTRPIKLEEDLNTLDHFLKENQKQADSLCVYLSSLGGTDVSNKTSRIIKTLLCDELTEKFSYFGKRMQKRPVHDLLLDKIDQFKHLHKPQAEI
nr:unnamed protein product [Callosobruchus analis]